jgi:hypothetical protein
MMLGCRAHVGCCVHGMYTVNIDADAVLFA